MKKFMVSLLALVLLLACAGCGGNGTTDNFTKGSDWVEVKEITYFLNAGGTMTDTTSNVSTCYTFTKNEERTVKVRFMEDGSLEIMATSTNDIDNYNGYNQTKRILPLSYNIVYLSK